MDIRRSARVQGPLQEHVQPTERTQLSQIVLRSRNTVNANNTNVPAISRLNTGTVSISDRRHSVTPLFSSYITPSPSPDELVIQQRGRKSLPLVWSPDIDKNKIMRSSARKTPTTPLSRTSTPNQDPQPSSSANVPGLLTTRLRRTPRKRLLLDDSLDTSTSTPSTRNSLNGTASSISRTESIRRTRAQLKKMRGARASMGGTGRTLSTCSSSSSLVDINVSIAGSSTSGTSSTSSVSSNPLAEGAHSSNQSSALHGSSNTTETRETELNNGSSDRKYSLAIPNDTDLSRSYPSPPESETSEPEGGLLTHRELKNQLCSLSADLLKDLLRDVLDSNPSLREEIVSGGGGTVAS